MQIPQALVRIARIHKVRVGVDVVSTGPDARVLLHVAVANRKVQRPYLRPIRRAIAPDDTVGHRGATLIVVADPAAIVEVSTVGQSLVPAERTIDHFRLGVILETAIDQSTRLFTCHPVLREDEGVQLNATSNILTHQ